MAVVTSAVALGAGAIAKTVGASRAASNQRKSQKAQERRQITGIKSATKLRNKLIDEARDGDYLGKYGVEDIFGSKREELDFGDVALDSIYQNSRNFAETDAFTRRVNDSISDAAIDRATKFSPNFTSNVANLSNASRSLIRGEIPEDVQRELFTSRAEYGNVSGVPGTYGAATLRDFGLNSLDGINQGANIFQTVNSIREQADPISRHISQQQFMTDPTSQLKIEEYNNLIRSSGDPAAQQLFNLELQGGTQDAYAHASVAVPTAPSAFTAGLGAFGTAATGLGSIGLANSTTLTNAFKRN